MQNTQLSLLQFNAYLAFSLLGAGIPIPTRLNVGKYFLSELMHLARGGEDRLGGDRGAGLSVHSSSCTHGTDFGKG